MSRTPDSRGDADRKHDPIRPAGLAATAKGGEAAARKDAGKPPDGGEGGVLAGIALRFTAWAERWFPDAFIFVAIAVVVVAAGALANGASVGGGHQGVRRRLLDPDPLHHADGVRHHRRLRRRDLAAGATAHRPLRPGPEDQPRRRRLHRRREHDRLAAQLGPQPDLRRASRPRHRTADRPARRLPRRGGRGLSRSRRHLGAGPELVRRPAPGQPREPAARAPADHRGDPVHRDDLPLAIDGDRRGADRDLDRDLHLVGAVRRRGGDRRGPRRRRQPARGGPAAARSSPANGSSTRRSSPSSSSPSRSAG